MASNGQMIETLVLMYEVYTPEDMIGRVEFLENLLALQAQTKPENKSYTPFTPEEKISLIDSVELTLIY